MDTKEWILSNGGIPPKGNNRRYQGCDNHEDKVQYKPTHKEPKVYTLVYDFDGRVVRKRGKWGKDRVVEQFPCARKFEHRVKSSGKLYHRESW
jgi:hypothetical protein